MDEVHERDEDTDLLLMVVRKFLRQTRTDCKIILMSATADAGKFAQYFGTPIIPKENPDQIHGASKTPMMRNAPIVEIPSGEPHPVRVYYLDDLQKLPVICFLIDLVYLFRFCKCFNDFSMISCRFSSVLEGIQSKKC